MVVTEEQICFLHLLPCKNCRKTLSERAALCMDIICATRVWLGSALGHVGIQRDCKGMAQVAPQRPRGTLCKHTGRIYSREKRQQTLNVEETDLLEHLSCRE